MSAQTPAQEEFANLLAKNSAADDDSDDRPHREDRDFEAREEALRGRDDEDEEDRYRASQIDAAMRMPTLDGPASATGAGGDIKLPPVSFDSGRSTGVKGVIADARSYESARLSKWKHRANAARRSVFGLGALNGAAADGGKGSDLDNSSGSERDADEESFLQQWRESRRLELENEARGGTIRNRRTSPSVRLYGRLDEVDALGYLDAIEKVGRETVVLVFVYDHEVCLSSPLSSPRDCYTCEIQGRRHWLTDCALRYSARSRQRSSRPCGPSSARTRWCTSSRCTTTTSSSITPPCRRCWRTATRATCLPT